LHAVNPRMSLSPPTNPPLQEQIGQDNATDLMSAPSELLRQNPSGLGRQEHRQSSTAARGVSRERSHRAAAEGNG